MSNRFLCGLLVVATLYVPSAGYGQAPVVTPTKLSFLATQGGSNPGTQTLNAPASAWTATTSANWITLSSTSGTGNETIIITATYETLMPGTLYGDIFFTSSGQSVKIPVTFSIIAPQPPIPSSANEEWAKACVDKSLNLNGDFQKGVPGLDMAKGNWSVGPSISTQLLKYDLAKKQAGFNTSVGAGASFRYYKDIYIKNEKGTPVDTVTVSQVKSECRQTTFGSRQSYLAAPFISITPTLYVTKPTNEGDLSVQPALLLGFFEDILNVGVGWNLTGAPGEKGNVFLLMSIGYGFSF